MAENRWRSPPNRIHIVLEKDTSGAMVDRNHATLFSTKKRCNETFFVKRFGLLDIYLEGLGPDHRHSVFHIYIFGGLDLIIRLKGPLLPITEQFDRIPMYYVSSDFVL